MFVENSSSIFCSDVTFCSSDYKTVYTNFTNDADVDVRVTLIENGCEFADIYLPAGQRMSVSFELYLNGEEEKMIFMNTQAPGYTGLSKAIHLDMGQSSPFEFDFFERKLSSDLQIIDVNLRETFEETTLR